jgi:hypothetical protein
MLASKAIVGIADPLRTRRGKKSGSNRPQSRKYPFGKASRVHLKAHMATMKSVARVRNTATASALGSSRGGNPAPIGVRLSCLAGL